MDIDIRKQIVSSHGHLISSSQSSVSVSHTNGHSVEDSGPPSPNSGPSINFAQVAAGIYRSSFPMAGNFEHLKSLGLRTILYRKYAGSKYRALDEKFFATFDAEAMLERLMAKMLPTPPPSEKDDDM
ncbi:MAG: hypothetical protein Q9167_005602 [Letrouitia subvulpina]